MDHARNRGVPLSCGNRQFARPPNPFFMTPPASQDERIAAMKFASVYPHYVTKVEKKGRTEEDLLKVIRWLTGFTKAQVGKHIRKES
ncbi:MAG: DUF2200 family protein, partial [Planctomycetota bacterium]